MTDPIEDVKAAAASGAAATAEALTRAMARLHDRLAALETEADRFVTRVEHEAAMDALRAEAAAKGVMRRLWAWLHTTWGLAAIVLVTMTLTSWIAGSGPFACVGV